MRRALWPTCQKVHVYRPSACNRAREREAQIRMRTSFVHGRTIQAQDASSPSPDNVVSADGPFGSQYLLSLTRTSPRTRRLDCYRFPWSITMDAIAKVTATDVPSIWQPGTCISPRDPNPSCRSLRLTDVSVNTQSEMRSCQSWRSTVQRLRASSRGAVGNEVHFTQTRQIDSGLREYV